MFELWGRRKETGSFELIVRFDRSEEMYYRLDELDNGDFVEGIILCDGHYVMYKKYELGKGMKM